MKKILVLTLMMLLGMYVMASDVTISGETLLEFYFDYDGGDSVYIQNGDVEVIVKAVVDDYNTAQVDMEAANTDNVVIDEGFFTSEVGKYAGLEDMGVSLTVRFGYEEWMNPQIASVTAHGDDEAYDFDDEIWGFDIVLGIMDMVDVMVALGPDPAEKFLIAGVTATIDPVQAQLFYTREAQDGEIEVDSSAALVGVDPSGVGDPDYEGSIGAAIVFGMDVMPGMFAFDLAASFYYSLNTDIETGDDEPGIKYSYGVGLATDIMEMLYIDAGVRGWEDAMLAAVFIAGGIDYQGLVGVDLGLVLTLDEDWFPETFDEFDGSVWAKVGAAKFRIGFLFHGDQTGGGYDLFDGATESGNFSDGLNCPDADLCTPVDAEGGVIYISGELDF
jgi:hypothetical protein